MPPLRRVRSCSPSASARTVTAHSLNAIGIFRGEGPSEVTETIPSRIRASDRAIHATGLPAFSQTLPKTPNSPANWAVLGLDAAVREPFVGLQERREVVLAVASSHRGGERVAGGRGRRERHVGVL